MRPDCEVTIESETFPGSLPNSPSVDEEDLQIEATLMEVINEADQTLQQQQWEEILDSPTDDSLLLQELHDEVAAGFLVEMAETAVVNPAQLPMVDVELEAVTLPPLEPPENSELFAPSVQQVTSNPDLPEGLALEAVREEEVAVQSSLTNAPEPIVPSAQQVSSNPEPPEGIALEAGMEEEAAERLRLQEEDPVERSRRFIDLWIPPFRNCRSLEDLNEVLARCTRHWLEKSSPSLEHIEAPSKPTEEPRNGPVEERRPPRRYQNRQQQRIRLKRKSKDESTRKLQLLYKIYPGRAVRKVFNERSERYSGSVAEAENYLRTTYEGQMTSPEIIKKGQDPI